MLFERRFGGTLRGLLALGQRLQFLAGEVFALVAEIHSVLLRTFERVTLSLDGCAAAVTAALAAHLLDGHAPRFETTPSLGRHLGEEFVDIGMKELAVEAVDSADGGAILESACVHGVHSLAGGRRGRPEAARHER